MIFLNPGILWGLLALSVPIIIHFFNLQRPRTVLFSNVAFVKEVKRSVVKRLKFKQWLLLLLRLLAVTFLVLTFANPIIVSENNTLLSGNRSVAYLIDNSYSMTAGNEKGPYFQQALNLVQGISEAYSNQDEFLLMTSSDIKLNYNFYDREDLLDELKNLEVEQNTTSLGEVCRASSNIFSNANYQFKEFYIISDFQSSTFMSDSLPLNMSDTSVKVKFLPIASRLQNNVYVSDHQIASQIIEKGKPVNIEMTIVNDENRLRKDLTVRIILEGRVATFDKVDLNANESQELELSFTPDQSGWLSGYIELDDYPIEFDNNRYFSLYVPEEEKILLVEGQPSPNVKVLYSDVFDQFATTFVSSRNLSSISLNEYRSIVFVGLEEMSTGLSGKLKNYLENGGSMLIFPGEKLVIDAFNSFLSPLGMGKIDEAVEITSGIGVETVDLEHPVFDGIFTQNNRNRSFDAPQVYKYYPLNMNNSIVQNQIMKLENQSPFLLESQIGEGLLFTFTIFPSSEWSDFPIKTVFAPILFRMSQIMNQTQQVQSSQEIGSFEPKILRTNIKDNLLLVSEDKERPAEIIVEPFNQRGVTILNFDNMFDKVTIREGNYRLLQSAEIIEKISFNIADDESKLTFMNPSDLDSDPRLNNIEHLDILPPTPENLQKQIQDEREGTPMWKYFLMLALAALILEIIVIKLFSNG